MERQTIQRKFEAMGARVKVRWEPGFPENTGDLAIDVLRDRKGEYFDLNASGPVEFTVLDLKPKDRHLLLMARIFEADQAQVIKTLCGHDEREWFAAQVPRIAAVNVDSAKEALKPAEAAASQARRKVKPKDRHRRKNKGFIRQGEWFFLPVEELQPDRLLITKKEPLMLAGVRGGSKPHVAEEAYRFGGETVYVHPRWAPRGITAKALNRLFQRKPQAAGASDWRTMRRNAQLYVRGAVRHPDHRTVILKDWHRVVVNREERGQAVVFLD